MSMKPVSGNSLDKSCGEVIGSNCCTWQGPDIPCLNICKGSSLTPVIYELALKVCEGVSLPACYTGTWVDVSSSFPTSGTSGGSSWTIGNFGTPSFLPENTPQYKWTRDGDIALRGNFEFRLTPAVEGQLIIIPVFTIPSTCFPSSFTAPQSVLIEVDAFGCNPGFTTFFKAYVRVELTGVVNIVITHVSCTKVPFDFTVSFGGVKFNL